MAYTESGKIAVNKYKAKNYKRIPLELKLDDYDELKKVAESEGESVNGFIKKILKNYIENKKNTP